MSKSQRVRHNPSCFQVVKMVGKTKMERPSQAKDEHFKHQVNQDVYYCFSFASFDILFLTLSLALAIPYLGLLCAVIIHNTSVSFTSEFNSSLSSWNSETWKLYYCICHTFYFTSNFEEIEIIALCWNAFMSSMFLYLFYVPTTQQYTTLD